MAATKISNLTAISTPALTDQFAVAQSGETKKMTLSQVRKLDAVNISGLGDPSTYQWHIAIVTDDVNGSSVDGRSIVYSDGVDWRRMSDGTVIALRPATYSMTISTTSPTVT